MSGQVWLIIPTYNEVENVDKLVRSSLSVLSTLVPGNFRILIVDDNSPDGTGRKAARLAEMHPEVRVLHRNEKAGLGKAYAAGFDYALRRGAEYLIEMDADFSHDPQALPEVLNPARDGGALVIGSRYVSGGKINNWGLIRRLLSRWGCLYAQKTLGVPIKDLTSGFRCFRAETLHLIQPSTVRSQGYAFQVELAYRTFERGLSVLEVPITFSEREHGKSKMSLRIAIEAIWLVPKLRWRLDQTVQRIPAEGASPAPDEITATESSSSATEVALPSNSQ